MLDFQQKRKIKAILYNRITVGFLLVIILFVIHSTWVVYRKDMESKELKKISEAHVSELNQRNDEIQSKIDKLATPVGVEEEIRSKFSVAKDGENVVVVVPSEDSNNVATSAPKSLWQKIKEYFLGR